MILKTEIKQQQRGDSILYCLVSSKSSEQLLRQIIFSFQIPRPVNSELLFGLTLESPKASGLRNLTNCIALLPTQDSPILHFLKQASQELKSFPNWSLSCLVSVFHIVCFVVFIMMIRRVPYFGGSDNYQYMKQKPAGWARRL